MKFDLTSNLVNYLHAVRGLWVPLGEIAAGIGADEEQAKEAIATLLSIGYDIKNDARRRYRLVRAPDRLLPDEVLRGLKTRVVGREIITYDSTASTMDAAWRLAESGAREGTTVFAEYQAAGRGRAGRMWTCPKAKGILMSVILRPTVPVTQTSALTIVGAVATAETVRRMGDMPAMIKWPNDVVVQGRKLAGILVESRKLRTGPCFVLGVGLNVNVELDMLPDSLRATTTSLLIEAGRPMDRVEVANTLLGTLDWWYRILLRKGPEEITEEWKRCSSTLGQRITIERNGKEFTGTVVDLSTVEGIVLRLDRGGTHVFRGEHVTVKQHP